MSGGFSSDTSPLSGAWPLVGRDRELAEIAAARADDGCHGVVVVAQAGVGKSRLAREAQATAEREGALIEWVQATRSAATVPLAAFADLVPDEVRSDDTVALLRRCGEDLRERAAGRPVVLGVDDAQLLDPMSATLVLHLATSASAFVLATVRAGEPCPDAIVSLWKDDAARRIELGALGDEDVRALVETALADPVEEAALRWVTDVSRGNALYVRELVRGAVDDGALVHGDGFWRMDGPPSTNASLVELVGRRMAELTTGERELVELLALGEPLTLAEIGALSSEHTLIAAEADDLVALTAGEVRLSHPLYGEAVRATLPPLRGRSLRLRLVEALRSREPLGPGDALRVARLLLDSDAALPAELARDAAEAANRAGDPDLGAQLAELAGAGSELPAGMLLAQAHSMRNRYEDAEAALAAVEPQAAASPDAHDYVRQRLSLYQWGLRRPAEITTLLERATTWSEDPDWQGFVARIGDTYRALQAGLELPQRELSAVATDVTRRSHATIRILSALMAGDGDAAARDAFAAPLEVPMDDAGVAALAVLSLAALESGVRWPDLELSMARIVRDGVRAHDHGAAGVAAFTLGRLQFLRGRYRDAARWVAEARVHTRQRDPFNSAVPIESLAVGVAASTGDYEGTAAALERLHDACERREPLPVQRVLVRRAEGWALRLRNPAEAARRLLEDTAALSDMPGLVGQLAYDALRAGALAAPVLEDLAARCESRLVTAYARHASARAARDGTALLEAAEEMAAIGALRYAVEAASDAAVAFIATGRQDSARRAAARARELHLPDQGGELPPIDGLDATAVDLTPREAQLIELASQGLSNAEIADRLIISVRTVETHLYRGMQKLGVSDRRELAGRRP
ncbi:MAG TPA: LuxR C-terminal-related transcriptional regulator [Solirubrobacteraceae bacterium]|nr:LuxR C-terminal-related transcriptional regulator [Solirubrobacteraceae bacterium]